MLFYGGARALSEYARAEGSDAARLAQSRAESATNTRFTAADPVSVDQSLWSKERVLAFARSIAVPAAPQGLLEIPAVRIEVPVYAGTSETNLNRGVAHIEGTAVLGASGNAGIAGHRDGFFRGLKDVALGDEILLRAASSTLRYRVAEIAVTEPADTSVLAASAVPSLTLVTCYPFYFVGTAPQRYVVRAELVDARSMDEGPRLATQEAMP